MGHTAPDCSSLAIILSAVTKLPPSNVEITCLTDLFISMGCAFAVGPAENAAQPKPVRQLTLETFLRGAVQRMVGGLGVSSSEVSIQGGTRSGRMLGTTAVSPRLIFCPSRMY